MTPSSSTPIADGVVAIKQNATQLPEAVRKTFQDDEASLDEAGLPSDVALIGTAMPDATLLDPFGTSLSLNEVQGDRPAVLVFYRGAWCPYCNLTLRTYQSELVGALDERGAALIAVSPQLPDGSLSMKEKNELTFSVLSDPGNRLARALGIVAPPNDAVRHAQLELGLDLSQVNTEATRDLPMPTTVIVDVDRVIRWIDVHPNYTTRSEPAEIIAAFDATVGREAAR